MIKHIALFIFLFPRLCCFGQWNGNPDPVVGQSYTYSYNDGTVYWGAGWSSDKGTASGQQSSGTMYWATITFTAGGSGNVNFLMNGGIVSSFPVNVSSCSPPATPPVTFVLDPSTCTPRNLTYTYSSGPPAGVTWYWQTSASGTSTANSTTSYAVTSAGNYYVRAYRSSGNCWSAGAASHNVATVTALPGAPNNPTPTTNTCGPKTLSKNGTIPGGVSWYWQGTNPNGTDYTSGTATASTFTANTSGTYYIRARNSSGCWSTGSGSVAVLVTALPPDPSVAFQVDPSTCQPRPISYTYTVGPPAQTTWYWQTSATGVSTANSTTNYLANSAGNYYVRAYNSSSTCWSSGAPSVSVPVVTPLPATPNNPTSAAACGPRTLSKNGIPASGISWYWQGTNANGTDYTSTAATALTYAVTTSGTYYIRARNDAEGCWSTSSGSLAVTVTPPPADPSVAFGLTSNTCGPRTVSYTGTPPAGITWYWQTSASGESTTNATTSYVVSAPGDYFVRAYNSSTGCWSTGAPSQNVPWVNLAPANPNNPIASTNTCGPKTLSKNGSPASGVSWYWQGTNANGTDYTSATATGATYSAPTSGTYYIRARSSAGCWSSGSGSVAVTIEAPSAPNNAAYQFCEWETMTLTASPYLSNLKWYDASSQLLFTGISYSPQNLDVGNYGYSVKNVSANGCESASAATITLTVKSNCDEYVNWAESVLYGINPDESPTPIAASRSYYDGFGNLMQSQDKSYFSNQVFASQVVNDNNGIATLSTLPAPINSSTFQYRHRFVTNNATPKQKYSASDFDAPNSPGSVDNPNPVGNNGPGTLGWYYSSANNLEPLTPVTGFPYSRSWAPAGPDPKIAKSAGPGAPYRMGSTHEIKSEKQKIVLGELAHYYRLRSHFVPTAIATAYQNLLANVSTSSTTDFAANQNVTRTASGGYINVTCNQSTSTPGVFPIGGTIPVTPGGTYTYRVKGYKNSSRLANLYVAKGTSGNIIWPGTPLPTGGISNEQWVSVTFVVPAGVTSVRVGVLWSQPLIGEAMSLSAVELYPEAPGAAPGYKTIVTDPNGKQVVSFADTDGRQLASATLAGASYDNWSYSYYNDLGQLFATVAPNGIVPGVYTLPQFVTYYKYDHLGRLIETTSADEGTSQFVYSSDGLLRFSQNQEQRNATTKRFSYTNYDNLGRLVESGEYTSSGTNPYVFEPHTQATPSTYSVLNLIDNVGFTGVSKKVPAQDSRCSDHTYVMYDLQAGDFPDASTASQDNLFGEISRTENANAISWYSYDEFHQLKKSWQKIIPMANAIKTVDYTYDYYGNVTEVAYQRGTPTEDYYHHYEYNSDQAVTKVETSVDGTSKQLRAKYFYYLHGPLKRVELGTDVQGIDYVYNIDGSLKLINHADPALDPGLDGAAGVHASFMADVFGEALDYNANDYTGAVYNEGTFTLDAGYPDQFGGAVKAIRWHNHVDGHIPRAYAFKYDNLYQLDNAEWGSMTGSAGSYGFSLSGLQAYKEDIGKSGVTNPYDKNGNILGLVRKGKTGNTLASYEYNYTANTNKLENITPIGGGTAILSYLYNAIGQMTQQTEGTSTMKVSYNAYGLVKEIKNASDQLISSYVYDDRGDVVLKTHYNDTTFYISDASGNAIAIYEKVYPDSILKLIEFPIYGSGRLAVYKPLESTVFYEISDHLGNVRNVIGNPEPLPPYVATLEDNGQPNVNNPRVQELAYFENLAGTAVQDVNMNHTAPYSAMPSPKYSSYVKWISGISGQDASAKSIGPAIGLKVEAGDKIDIETWAKYKNKTSYSRSDIVGAMASILGGSFVGSQTGLEILSNATQTFQNGISLAVGVGGNGNDVNTRPYAYVYYLLYDRSFNPITQGWKRVSTSAGFDPGMEAFSTHEKLTIPTVNITEPGYIYVFVSNESENTEVWFDDLKVAHERSRVVAGADYFALGLPMENREITREDYRYGFQGEFSEKDLATDWNRFELRMYDSRVGRWISPDPYGQYSSPYMAMGNTPQTSVDPDGGLSIGGVLPEVVVTGASYATMAAMSASFSIINSLTTVGMFSGGCKPLPCPQGTRPEQDLNFNGEIPIQSDPIYPEQLQTLPKPDTGPLFPPVPESYAGTISAVKPNMFARWNASWIPGSSFSYSIVNGAYVGFASFFLKPFIGDDIYNLDNSYASPKERQIAFASTASSFIPIGGLTKWVNKNNWVRFGKGFNPNLKPPGQNMRFAWGAHPKHLHEVPKFLRGFNQWLRKQGGGHFHLRWWRVKKK